MYMLRMLTLFAPFGVVLQVLAKAMRQAKDSPSADYFYVHLTKTGVIWKEGISTEKTSLPIGLWEMLWTFSWLMIDVVGPSSLWAEPPLNWWPWVPGTRKWTNNTMRSKPASGIPPWSASDPVPQVSTLTSFDDGLWPDSCKLETPFLHQSLDSAVLSQQQKP